MGQLLIHCGGRRVDFEQVEASITPPPVGTHYPIPHARILELAVAGLEDQGLHVVGGEHALDKDGARYFGLLQLTNGHNNDDHGLVAAIRNTHDKSFAASMALGSWVFCCDNLAFSGEVTIARKHTRQAEKDLPSLVNKALGRLGSLRRSQEMRIEGYKAAELTNDQAYATIVRASHLNVIPNAKIPDVVKQWHYPLHEEFQARTGWSLFNGFTEVLKSYQAQQIPARTQALHGVMDSTCQLEMPTRHIVVDEDEESPNL